MSPNWFDIIIVGAGPIGLACGIEAEKKGFDYLIIEAGCLVNSLFNYPINMTFFSTSDRLEIGEVPFISHGYKPTRTEALEYYRRVVQSWNLRVKYYENVLGAEPFGHGYKVQTSKDIYFTNNLIVATGFYGKPNLMGIPGEELPKVKHYFKEPHPYVGQKIIVIGGGNSAVDVALETYRKGADVTMVIMTSEIDKGVKYWVKPDIENRIKEGSIKAYFNTTVKAIHEKEVELCTPSGEITVPNDFVLAMTGYQPDFDLLSKIGVDITCDNIREPAYNPETFESNKKGIFLAGCVCGGMNTSKWNIESSRYHAQNIINYIASKEDSDLV